MDEMSYRVIENLKKENEDLKDEQRLVGEFKSLEQAIDYSNQLQTEWDSIDEYEFVKMLHHIGIVPYSERN